jgi:hypothetical protein
MAYQLEDELNHAGYHAAMSPEAAQLRIIQAAAALHKAEQEALKDAGLGQTPIAVNASFDYELIKLCAIAGTTLSDDAYTKAYGSLKQFLRELGSSTDIDVIGVDWFAGSISAGGTDKFSNLLRALTADFAVSTNDGNGSQPALATTALLALAKQDVIINPIGPQAGGLVTLTMSALRTPPIQILSCPPR